jgi:hypothetical protein
VRIFADPIRTLDLCFDRSIRLSGIKSKRPTEEDQLAGVQESCATQAKA